jgi:Kelch motif
MVIAIGGNMKTKISWVIFLMLVGIPLEADAQVPAVTHNTWTNAAPMPVALDGAAAAVSQGKIYLLGGFNGSTTVANIQIYNPAANAWEPTNAQLPEATA